MVGVCATGVQRATFASCRRMLSCRPVFLVAVGMLVTLSAQTSKPTFEVASVKRNTSGSGGWNVSPRPGGVYNATNAVLPLFIQFAFDIDDYQLLGGPSWMQTDRFDIAARAGRETPTAELRLMMQTLLEDRFKLIIHKEQRDMSIFALVLERSDGRLGEGLKSVDDCAKANQTVRDSRDAPTGA